MKLQRGDKTFMACLEHIPWCIRLCSLDVERSGGKKKEKKSRRAFCCSPESPKTKAGCIKTSVREVTMWTVELCKSENCRQSVQRFWLMFVCLTNSLPTPNGSSNKGGKKVGWGGRCRLRIDFALLYFVNYLYVNAPLQLCDEGGLVLTLFSSWMIITGFLFDIYLH